MSDFDGVLPPTGIKWNGGGKTVGMVEYGGGAGGQSVVFYTRPVHNPTKSREMGSPVYEDKVYVRIAPPGERLNIQDRPATGQDLKIWPNQWMAYQQNREQIPEGTPISLLYPDQPSIGEMLKANNVHTIQQCAELSANAIENIGMGAQRYVNAAQAYMKMAGGGAAVAQIRNELEDKDREIKVLTRQLDELKDEVRRLQTGNHAAQQVVTMTQAQLQELLAARSLRPEMPEVPRSRAFDPAEAMINANSTQAVVAQEAAKPRKRAKL